MPTLFAKDSFRGFRMTGKRDAYHQTRRNQTVGGRGSRFEGCASFAGQQTESRIESGPFKATANRSRLTGIPEWYRDAKFGIWAHWDPSRLPSTATGMRAACISKGNGNTTSRPNLWPSVDVWFQGCDPNLEGRQVRSGISGWSLQAGRREILCQHGCASRQLLSLESETHALELGPDGTKKDIVGLFRKAALSTDCGSE